MQRHLRAWVPLVLTVLAGGGCGAIVSIDRAVLAYDRTTNASAAKLLLLNIARARRNQPMHFTGISSIAATYKFGFNAGLGPAVTGNQGALLLPIVGGSVEENPTISIAPMQGDEFTQRLLTPFPEQKLTLLLRQGYDVDALLRLLGSEVILVEGSSARQITHYNRPSDRDGYATYRRVMAHLSSIQDRHALRVEPLHYTHSWSVAEDAVTPETYLATYKDFSIRRDADQKGYRVTKRINGRVLISNYDPDILPNGERLALYEEAEAMPPNDVLIDIRADHPGGELPLRGHLRLRSFHEVLTFVGRGIEEEREFDVTPDPRTPKIGENPTNALEIRESKSAPKGADFSVVLDGFHYSIADQRGYPWNRKAFSLLSQLFQMSVSAVPQAGPAITISK